MFIVQWYLSVQRGAKATTSLWCRDQGFRLKASSSLLVLSGEYENVLARDYKEFYSLIPYLELIRFRI